MLVHGWPFVQMDDAFQAQAACILGRCEVARYRSADAILRWWSGRPSVSRISLRWAVRLWIWHWNFRHIHSPKVIPVWCRLSVLQQQRSSFCSMVSNKAEFWGNVSNQLAHDVYRSITLHRTSQCRLMTQVPMRDESFVEQLSIWKTGLCPLCGSCDKFQLSAQLKGWG